MSQDGDISDGSGGHEADNDITISKAPLHVAQPSRHWASQERIATLKESFPNLKQDKWTKSEKRTLKYNWKRIQKRWPQYSDPKFAFGSGHDNEGKWTPDEIDEKRKDYKEFQVLSRIANGIDDRLLCDIYMKCRKKFYDKSFHFTDRGSVPQALEKSIIRDIKSNESTKIISEKYNVSPSVVDTIRRRPRRRRTQFVWSEDSINDLKLSLELVHGTEIPLSREISWKKVTKEMRRLGYHVDRTQCYNKWTRLNPSSVIKR